MNLSELVELSILAGVAPRQALTGRILDRLRAFEMQQPAEALRDEQVWTLLCTYGYAIAGPNGIAQLGQVLTEQEGSIPTATAWLEMLPLPPRQGAANANESNTEVDLILGDVGVRQGTAGVQYHAPQDRDGWVCLVEAKYHSDIASHTTYDPCRNQMARVIETALTFQASGLSGPLYPQKVHFTLLTPLRFTVTNRVGGGPRLYGYKFREYKRNPQALFDDIENASVSRRSGASWQYPDLERRLEQLSLHWITYEHLIRAMPEGAYKQAFVDFIQRQPGCLLDLSAITGSAA